MIKVFPQEQKVPNQFIKDINGVSIYLKREDLLHPSVSGNKFRKLKYNLEKALLQHKKTVLTFGGAFSNHIAATAAAGKIYGLETIGIIRGDELGKDMEKTLKGNDTLSFAVSCGMKLVFISREDYRERTSEGFLAHFRNSYGDFFPIPEGGTNNLAIKGCEEILTERDRDFNIICCPVGTGGTISGLINSSSKHQKILGFPVLNGDFLTSEIQKFTAKTNWELILKYNFKGYAKVNEELIHFINNFKTDTGIKLDPVYTGKMMFAIFDLIKKGVFPENTRILAIHTGGLQGIAGMNRLLENKGLPQINV